MARIVRPYYIGIDFSMNCTGMSIRQGDKINTFSIKPHTSWKHLPPVHRLNRISNNIIQHMEHCLLPSCRRCTFVCLEDYAYGAVGKTFAIAECVGMLKFKLILKYGLPVENLILVSVPHVKLFCTGKGVAPKDLMIKEVYKRWRFDTCSNDQADAFTLQQIAKALQDPARLTGFQKDAVNRVRTYNAPKSKPRSKRKRS